VHADEHGVPVDLQLPKVGVGHRLDRPQSLRALEDVENPLAVAELFAHEEAEPEVTLGQLRHDLVEARLILIEDLPLLEVARPEELEELLPQVGVLLADLDPLLDVLALGLTHHRPALTRA
jgi:hypothetical protein